MFKNFLSEDWLSVLLAFALIGLTLLGVIGPAGWSVAF